MTVAAQEVRRRHRPLRHPVNEQHMTDYEARMKEALREWTPRDSPLKEVQDLQRLALDVLEQTKPKARVPKKPWISEPTWSLVSTLRDLRKCKAALHQGQFVPKQLLDQVWNARLDPLVQTRIRNALRNPDSGCQQALLRVEVKILEKSTQKALRNDKRMWVQAQCEKAEAAREGNLPREAYYLVKKITGQTRKATKMALIDGEGHLVHDQEQVQEQWMSHWAKHLRATRSGEHSFANIDFEPECVYDVPEGLRITPSMVLKAMRSMNRFKSSPDPAPLRLWRPMEQEMSRCLARAFSSIQSKGQTPDAYDGSVIIPVKKGAKAPGRCESYRPIQLMLSETKILSKLVLEQLKEYVVFDQRQFAIGPTAGIDHAHVVVSHVIAKAMEEKRCLALVYIDLVAAFDQVVRQLIVLEQDPTAAKLALLGMGLTEEQTEQTVAHVRGSPLALVNRDMPPFLLQLVRQWNQSPWIQVASQPIETHYTEKERALVGKPVTLCTTRGTRQGDNLSGCIFAGMLQLVMQEVRRDTRGMHTPISFKPVKMRDLVCDDHGDSIEVLDVDYADDLILPVCEACPIQLLHATSRVLSAVDDIFRRYGFPLNYAAQKTQISLNLVSGKAKGVWQSIKDFSANVERTKDVHEEGRMWLPLTRDRHVQICQSYVHLGRLTAADGNMRREIAVRCARAHTAFNKYSRALTNRQFTIQTRLHFFRSLVLVHLVQGLHTMPVIPEAQARKLRSTYVRLLKRMVHMCPVHEGQDGVTDTKREGWWSALTNEQFLQVLGQPCLEDILDARRLCYMRRAMVAENGMLRAVLAYQGKRTIWPPLYCAMNKLRERANLDLPMASPGTLATWAGFIVPGETEWAKLVKSTLTPRKKVDVEGIRRVRGEVHGVSEVLVERCIDDEEMVEPDDRFVCDICGRRCANGTGLGAHKRLTHGVYNPIALRVFGTACPICGSEVGTREKVLDHLRLKAECAMRVLHELPAVSAEEYADKVREENKKDTRFLRQHIPRSGPINDVDGCPKSESVKARLVDFTNMGRER
eukprot:2071907-Amphidinium_carterae.3